MDLTDDEHELVRRYRAMPAHYRPPFRRLSLRLLNDVPRVKAEYLLWQEIVRADTKHAIGKR